MNKLFEEIIKDEFSYLDDYIYLNNSSFGMPPQHLYDYLKKYFDAFTVNCGENLDEFLHETYVDGKKVVAKLLKTNDRNIAYFKSTSDGIINIANSLELQSGDNVILTNEEHPANVIPWLCLEKQGVETRFVKSRDRQIFADDVISMIDEKTKVVSISSTYYCTGCSIDLKKIAKECSKRDIILVVDAIQSLGKRAIYPEEIGIDFLVAGAFKAIMGVKGCAFGYISDKLLQKTTPFTGSNQSVENCGRPNKYYSYDDLVFKLDASKFENGNHNYIGILSLIYSIGIINKIGIEEIERRINELESELREELQNLPIKVINNLEGESSGIVVVCVDERLDYKKLCDEIKKTKLKVALRDQSIRIGISFYNNLEQMNEAIKIIRNCVFNSVILK